MEQGKGAFAGFNANASMSRGHVDGNGSQYQLSELNAGGKLNLVSGGNVTLQGIAKGQQVVGDIAGDLKLDSLQDTSTYHSQNQTLSAEGTYGAGFSGSISYSQQKMDADYASVQRQSGIQAGDGGFQLKVGGTTSLNGAALASSDKAVADGKNSLQTGALVLKDIDNHTDYSASSTSVSVGTGGPGGGLPMQASGHDSSTTRAGISGGSLTITNNALQEAQTGQTASQAAAGANRNVSSDKDGSGKLANNFDANQVQGLFDAANALNQQVGTFISNKMQAAKEAKEALKRAEDNGLSKNSDEYHKLQQEAIDTEEDAAKWAPGSRRGQVITAVMAGITGNLGNSLAGMAQNAGIAYLQGMGAQEVKAYLQDLSSLGLSKEKTEALRTIMQSAVGCAGAAASGQSCGAGAAGGAGAVVLNNALNVLQGIKPEDMNAEQKADRENLVNTLVTGVALGTGGASTAATTVNAAKTEVENNSLLLGLGEGFQALEAGSALHARLPGKSTTKIDAELDGKPSSAEKIDKWLKDTWDGAVEAKNKPGEFADWVLEGFGITKPLDPNIYKDPPVQGAEPGDKTKGRSTLWEKPGGIDEANKDFDHLQPSNVRVLPNGMRVGTLGDGRTVIVREKSSDGRPTLEIQQGKSKEKVRYGHD